MVPSCPDAAVLSNNAVDAGCKVCTHVGTHSRIMIGKRRPWLDEQGSPPFRKQGLIRASIFAETPSQELSRCSSASAWFHWRKARSWQSNDGFYGNSIDKDGETRISKRHQSPPRLQSRSDSLGVGKQISDIELGKHIGSDGRTRRTKD